MSITKKMFKVSELQDNGIDSCVGVGPKGKVFESGWRLVENNCLEHRRWATTHRIVFQTPDQILDNEWAWACYYDDPATECQEVDDDDNPFYLDDGEIEATLMKAIPSVSWTIAK